MQSYNNAWGLLRNRQETRAVLALKMESLGIVPEPIDEPTSLIQTSNNSEQPLVEENSAAEVTQ